jgi:hypothetical protein
MGKSSSLLVKIIQSVFGLCPQISTIGTVSERFKLASNFEASLEAGLKRHLP